jgi:hypothetical protein
MLNDEGSALLEAFFPRKTKADGHIGRRAGGPLIVSACDPILHGNKTV